MKKPDFNTMSIFIILILITTVISGCGNEDSTGSSIIQNPGNGNISFSVKWSDMDIYNTRSDNPSSPDVKYIKLDVLNATYKIVQSQWFTRDRNDTESANFSLSAGLYFLDMEGYKDDKLTLVSHRRTAVNVRAGEISSVLASLGISIINRDGTIVLEPRTTGDEPGDIITFVNNSGNSCVLSIGNNSYFIPSYDPENPNANSFLYTIPDASGINYQVYNESGVTRLADGNINITDVSGFTSEKGIYVDVMNGNDTGGNGTEEKPYKTLEYVTRYVKPPGNSTILLVASSQITRYTPLSTIKISNNLTVKKAAKSGINECIVDFGGKNCNFTLYGCNVTFSNLTITGGGDSGIKAYIQCGVNIDNCKISGNMSESDGGGINIFKGTLNMNYVTVTGNTSTYGKGGGIWILGNLFINSVTITENRAEDGGGIYNHIGPIMDKFNGNSTISGNSADRNGGGIYIWEGDLYFSSSGKIENNKAGSGGGIYVCRNGDCDIRGNWIIRGNSPDNIFTE